jgi:polar amino acid transport system substrate-binding protein
MRMLVRLLAIALVLLPATGCSPDAPPPAVERAAAGAGPGDAAPPGPAPAGGCRLTMGWDPWPPFHYMGFGGELTGFDIELVRAMAVEAGCELHFERDSWADLLGRIRNGHIDLVTGATMTDARQEYALFSVPFRHEEFALFIRVGESHAWEGDSLRPLMDKGLRLGITDAYLYDDSVEEVLADPALAGQITRSRFGEANIGRLLDGEIDAFVEDVHAARTMLRRLGFEGAISRHPLSLGEGIEVRIMYSRASVPPELVERLDAGLARIRARGEYESLVQRYLN